MAAGHKTKEQRGLQRTRPGTADPDSSQTWTRFGWVRSPVPEATTPVSASREESAMRIAEVVGGATTPYADFRWRLSRMPMAASSPVNVFKPATLDEDSNDFRDLPIL
jgi:hypothetical protein